MRKTKAIYRHSHHPQKISPKHKFVHHFYLLWMLAFGVIKTGYNFSSFFTRR